MSNKTDCPYAHRLLGASTFIAEKSERRAPESLALVLLANLRLNDTLSEGNVRLSVLNIEGEAITVDLNGTKHNLTAETAMDSKPFESLKLFFGDEAKQAGAVGEIIERDPAIYRRRLGGWVLIDELVAYTGNVTYPKTERSIKKNSSPKLEREAKEEQLGFDF
jgi:hypothetical protein